MMDPYTANIEALNRAMKILDICIVVVAVICAVDIMTTLRRILGGW